MDKFGVVVNQKPHWLLKEHELLQLLMMFSNSITIANTTNIHHNIKNIGHDGHDV